MDECDYLEMEYGNKDRIECKLKEVEDLCKIANVDVKDCIVYADLMNELESVCNTINALTRIIAEKEQEAIKSKVVDSVASEGVVEILDFVL